jgi:Ca2+-binding RTX toxin-like protein
MISHRIPSVAAIAAIAITSLTSACAMEPAGDEGAYEGEYESASMALSGCVSEKRTEKGKYAKIKDDGNCFIEIDGHDGKVDFAYVNVSGFASDGSRLYTVGVYTSHDRVEIDRVPEGAHIKAKLGEGSDNFSASNDDCNYVFMEVWGQKGADEIMNASVAYGGKGSDILWACEGGSDLYGNEGNDRIYADDGEDYIRGGHASDSIFNCNSNDDCSG